MADDIDWTDAEVLSKLSVEELVKGCRRLANSLSFYRRRVELLQYVQHTMRDPERVLVCDILANAMLMRDQSGERYGFITHGNEHYWSQGRLRRDPIRIIRKEDKGG